MTQDLKNLIAYFNEHKYILPQIVAYFSWGGRACTPVEAVLFWQSIPESEQAEYVFAIHNAMYEIQFGSAA